MIQKQDLTPILGGPRRRNAVLVVALSAIALLWVVAAAGTATAQSDQPTVVISDGTTAPDSTTTVDIVLTSAPNGLAGYYLELTTESPEVAQIESASYPDRYGLTSEPEIISDGTAVTLEAADVDGVVGSGATDVMLATVTISGAAPGAVTLSVEPQQFDADDGSAFSPITQSGTVTVIGEDTETAAVGPSSDETRKEGEGGGAEMPVSGTDSGDSTDTGIQTTSESGPLHIALSLVAIVIITVIGLRRRP